MGSRRVYLEIERQSRQNYFQASENNYGKVWGLDLLEIERQSPQNYFEASENNYGEVWGLELLEKRALTPVQSVGWRIKETV